MTDTTKGSPRFAHWARQIEGVPNIVKEAVAEMAAQPHFADACRDWLRVSMMRNASRPALMRITRDVARFYYGFFVLLLDARPGGLTLSAIQEFCVEVGLASPGRAAVILVHLRAIGYVKPGPNPVDRRVRRYVPSQDMREAIREALVDLAKAFSLVEPDALTVAERLYEPEFFRAMILECGEAVAHVVKAGNAAPPTPIAMFADRNSGFVILYDMILSAADGDTFPPEGRVSMSVTALAKRHGVSRSHVFRLLRDAEQSGYLMRDADLQAGTLLEPLRRDLTKFLAYLFMSFALLANKALISTSAAAGTSCADTTGQAGDDIADALGLRCC